jgi:uncharacterized alpha-E superfamily protein
MTPNSLVERLDTLERTVEALAGLPARVAVVDVQISQLRDEMRIGFSAVRDDIAQTNARMLELHEETTTSIGLRTRSCGRCRKTPRPRLRT